MIRFFDTLFSGLALLAFSPVFLPTCLILRFTGEGEVFYKQSRIGRFGKEFYIYKFATMQKDSPNVGSGTITLKDDPRVLPLGKFLRRSKINELPQLINVLMGDMSLIGPRPQTRRCFDVFDEEDKDRIIQIKPGLSGIGPVIFRSEENLLSQNGDSQNFYDEVISPYKGCVEAWYADRVTLRNYAALICLTLWVIVFPKSQAVWKIFPDLPAPPDILLKKLNYPDKNI